ncbi:MAG: hypothetical protein COV44_03570 [Deltaproteobacteria bacterium CG11_big_fil_rev_8_21_14_0_20_45_16]|nr:MAG: hypothetical protein COV44_03570 [Deltaproteobacteria bacterium CG11_big_fil_rev_8_21_14_0_20_45_16]
MYLGGSAFARNPPEGPLEQKPSPISGAGLSLRECHFSQVIEKSPPVPWFEILADNFLNRSPRQLRDLEQIRSDYPIVFHCVGMNLGSASPVDKSYLKQVKVFSEAFKPEWISDHLCWTEINGHFHHDLLPLPYTSKIISHVTDRIKTIQDFLGQEILIENISSYIRFKETEMNEWDFFKEVSVRSGALLLLDINNIYVNSVNHGFKPEDYLNHIPRNRVRQMHLAGFEKQNEVLIDTHGHSVAPVVWNLYEKALEMLGSLPTCLERDNNLPNFENLLDEIKLIKARMEIDHD